jgi:hypothetical protein
VVEICQRNKGNRQDRIHSPHNWNIVEFGLRDVSRARAAFEKFLDRHKLSADSRRDAFDDEHLKSPHKYVNNLYQKPEGVPEYEKGRAQVALQHRDLHLGASLTDLHDIQQTSPESDHNINF